MPAATVWGASRGNWGSSEVSSIATFTARRAARNTAEEDLLTVYAEAFERDADQEDFSLEALL